MKLYIDSTDNSKTIIRLDDEEYVKNVSSPRDQDVFGFMLDCFDKKHITPNQITEVAVNCGPGSFTGTRVGVTIANAIAFSLKIKVNGVVPPVEPLYSSPPSITMPK